MAPPHTMRVSSVLNDEGPNTRTARRSSMSISSFLREDTPRALRVEMELSFVVESPMPAAPRPQPRTLPVALPDNPVDIETHSAGLTYAPAPQYVPGPESQFYNGHEPFTNGSMGMGLLNSGFAVLPVANPDAELYVLGDGNWEGDESQSPNTPLPNGLPNVQNESPIGYYQNAASQYFVPHNSNEAAVEDFDIYEDPSPQHAPHQPDDSDDLYVSVERDEEFTASDESHEDAMDLDESAENDEGDMDSDESAESEECATPSIERDEDVIPSIERDEDIFVLDESDEPENPIYEPVVAQQSRGLIATYEADVAQDGDASDADEESTANSQTRQPIYQPAAPVVPPPHVASPVYQPVSPHYAPRSPAGFQYAHYHSYRPVPPNNYQAAAPLIDVASPVYEPVSPQNTPSDSPEFMPISPTRDPSSPSHEVISPTTPPDGSRSLPLAEVDSSTNAPAQFRSQDVSTQIEGSVNASSYRPYGLRYPAWHPQYLYRPYDLYAY